jgi:hypothetical protein
MRRNSAEREQHAVPPIQRRTSSSLTEYLVQLWVLLKKNYWLAVSTILCFICRRKSISFMSLVFDYDSRT